MRGGAALMDFLIAIAGLCIIVGLIFIALEKISPDDWFKKIGRYAVGGAALLAFLLAIKAVLFGGAGGLLVSPGSVIEFAVGLIVLMVILYVVYLAIDRFAPADIVGMVKYVVGGIALIVILVLAQQALFGGGLGVINFGNPKHAMLGVSYLVC